MQGFKNFLMQGNVVQLAVAVVIGTAFSAIVTAFTDTIITPIIAAIGGVDDIEKLTLGPIQIGVLLAAILNFLIVAAVCYFALILPMQKLKEASDRRKGITPEEEVTDVDLLREIRDLLQNQNQGQRPTA